MFLLFALQSPTNIGMILRTAEVFETRVIVFDPHGVMSSEHIEKIADFACGALGRRPPVVSDDIAECLSHVEGRLIATGLGSNAKPLPFHQWEEGDCIVLGNEYDGVPDDFASRTDSMIWVPTTDQHLPKPRSTNPIDPNRVENVRNNGDASLNVAATAAIIGYTRFQALKPLLVPRS